ncbi:MAG: mammalian cell entry protein [Rhizobiales bacterium 65-9]|nr:MCE family protein [Hyphomicrobiales bacterium]OJY34281.1 MAG: mammalian cell entry protein [Rhizobiales bacterium 65-9]
METRANYALIGLFTLAAVAAMFGFAIWFAGARGNASRQEYRVVFSGSVTGLSRGASVLFNGLRVGEVGTIQLLPEDPRRVVAKIEVDPSTPVRSDTRARLEYQGLTGVAAIQLSGGEPGSQPLMGADGQPPTIFADRSDFQDIMETVQRLSRRTDDILNRVERVVADNEQPLNQTVKNIETFTNALAANSDGIDKFLSSTTLAGDRIATLAAKLETFTNDLDGVVKAIDPQRVSRIVGNIDSFADAVGSNKEQIDSFLKSGSELARRLNDSTTKLDEVLAEASSVLRGVDPAAVSRSLQNIDRVTTTIAGNNAEIDKALKDFSSIGDRLNAASKRVDGVLASVERFFGTDANGEAKGMMADIGAAAKSVRTLADNLDKRTADLTTGFKKLTGPGLRDFEALTADGRRTLNDLSRVVRSIERNPNQLIFGGQSALPEYQGRR